jgi:hypothetical protein
MSGPRATIRYLSDDGNEYAVGCPTWQIALAGNPAGTGTELQAPKGLRPRYRMIRNTDNGREKRVVCASVASTFWAEAMHTTHTAVDDGTTAGIANAEAAGRVGEKQKMVG